MALKKPVRRTVSEAEAEALANRLADRPYGETHNSSSVSAAPPEEKIARTTISLPLSLLREVEDIALENKRNGTDPKNVSAIIREALNAYLKCTSSDLI